MCQECVTPNNANGNCIPIKECTQLYTLLEESPRPIPPELANLLRMYTCGFSFRGEVNIKKKKSINKFVVLFYLKLL